MYKSKKQINYPLEWIPNLREMIAQFDITFYFCYFLKISYRVSSPYTGHIPYSGQFRATKLHSYLNVFMFCCLFEKREGFQLISNKEFYNLKVIKLLLYDLEVT